MSEQQGQGRVHLKEYFETDKMPTEDHFSELIDSSLNKTDDQLTVTDAGGGANSARFIGIGSTDPQSPVSVRNRTGDTKLIGLEDADGIESWHLSINPPAGSNGLLVASNNDPNAALMIGADGNVGVGTHAPTEKLEVNGNISITNGDLNMATGNLNLTTGSADIGGNLVVDGNTGIGTDTPEEKLDVTGNIRVTNGNVDLTDGNLNLATGDMNIVTGNANIAGDLTVDGQVIVTNSNLNLTDGDLSIATGGADIAGELSIEGNTGMGTLPDPAFRLDVLGNIRADGNIAAQSFEGDVNWNNITGVPDSLQNFNGIIDWSNVTGKPNSLIPAGVIVMWSGNALDIPETWAICDGANGTPDLSGRFIVASGGGYVPGDTGGQNEVTLTIDEMPVHDHPNDLATESSGNHSHILNYHRGDGSGNGNRFDMTDGGSHGTVDTNTTGAHTHTISGGVGNAGSGQAHENRPLYYALCFIMKL